MIFDDPFKFTNVEVAIKSLVIPDANKAMPKDHIRLASPQIFVTAIYIIVEFNSG